MPCKSISDNLNEYNQARQELREKLNNYRFIIITLVTGSALLGTLMFQNNFDITALFLPWFFLVWTMFLAYNYSQVSSLREYISDLDATCEGKWDSTKYGPQRLFYWGGFVLFLLGLLAGYGFSVYAAYDYLTKNNRDPWGYFSVLIFVPIIYGGLLIFDILARRDRRKKESKTEPPSQLQQNNTSH